MRMKRDETLAYAGSHRARFVEELKQLVRFPSVSAEPERRGDVVRCASWLADHLRLIGLERVRLVSTRGHPIVIAESRRAPGRPTVLIYGHYDVQPAGPAAGWRSPPFSVAVQDGYLHGRGASDDKGQLFAHVKAMESFLRTSGRLPVNVLCVFEGEEEIGSRGLLALLRQNPTLFEADIAVISDTRMLRPGLPAITYALRGMVGARLTVRGLEHEVHSGHYGGVIMDPAHVLCRLISGLHDDRERIAVSGFYDRVRTVSRQERMAMARVGPSDRRMLWEAGAHMTAGEEDFSAYERATIRPALTVTELHTELGETSGGASIPTSATADLDLRLVPDQDARETERALRARLARSAGKGIPVSLVPYTFADPVVVSPLHPALRAAANAYRVGFGAAPAFVRSGGSIPVAAALSAHGVTPVLMGFALPDDGAHAPNERFALANFFRGIATSIAFLSEIGR